MTVIKSLASRATGRLFQSWSPPAAPAFEAELIEPADEPELEILAAFVRHLAASLGADGAVVTLSGARGERLLYGCGVCVAADGAARLPPPRPRSRRARLAAVESVGIEWREQSGEAWMLLSLPASQGEAVTLALLFEEPTTELRVQAEQEAAAIEALVAGFLRLWTVNARSLRRVDALAAALDRCDVGVILLDRDAQLIFANAGANDLLDTADAIRRRAESIGATDLSDAVRLQVAIEHMLACVRDGRSGAECAAVVALARPDGRRALLATIVEPDPSLADGEVGALVYLLDPEQDMRPMMEPACRLYGLSPAETRLACLLAMGEPLADAAKTLRIRPHTARSYLKQIFLKTDTRRQTDLVRLLMSSIVRTSRVGSFQVL